MAKEAVFQLRMDTEVKEQVEQLYQDMGTSFAEAVRIFAMQSLRERGMPFKPTSAPGKAFGVLSDWANPELMPEEEGAFARAMEEKHAAH